MRKFVRSECFSQNKVLREEKLLVVEVLPATAALPKLLGCCCCCFTPPAPPRCLEMIRMHCNFF